MVSRTLAAAFAAAAYAAQPSARPPVKAPLRELPWGQLNFLHSSDTHGWHAGHLLEPSYSADWGDYISFATHLRARADKENVDVLLIDTGDRVEGNGLYDASEPKGKYLYDIIKQLDIDVICMGNHELYKANTSRNELEKTVPNFKGSYLASNIDFRKNSTDDFQPFAPRYKTFKTKNLGIRILAFGFLFDFQGAANNTRVIPVEDTIKEQWFQDAIREEVDLFLVAGHVPVRSEEFEMIFKAIRAAQWDTPIQFFGGHTHTRDFAKYDSKAYALESGRYMETIGFASINGLNSEKKGLNAAKSSLGFNRMYLDNNLYSYHAHSGFNETTFPTAHGKNVSEQIAIARKELKLDETHGCAPQTLWVNRVKVDDKDSIYRWLQNEVIVDQLTDPDPDAQPKLIITNTGAVRFDLFKGPFTRDSEYLISPFTSGYRYIKDIDSDTAIRVVEVLNKNAPILQQIDPSLDPSLLVPARAASNFAMQTEENIASFLDRQAFKDKPLTPGFTTIDDAGDDGDDTLHSPIQYYEVPNVIQSKVNFPSEEASVDKVDVVYNEFLQPWIIIALRFLGAEYDEENTAPYLGEKSLTEVIDDWVESNWQCNDKDEL